MPRLIVAALIKKGRKYLLTQEKLKDGQNYWIIPGGGVEFGETLEQAAAREIKEELGLDIKITKFLAHHEAIFIERDYHTVIFFFLAKALNDQITLEPAVLDAQYFSAKQVKKLQLVNSAKWLFENYISPRG